MTDFNKIGYCAVIEFLTLDNVPPQQIHNRMTVVPSCHGQALDSRVSSRHKLPWRWAPVGTSVWSSLWRKLSCCWKYCTAKSSSQCAADSRRCRHKHWVCWM